MENETWAMPPRIAALIAQMREESAKLPPIEECAEVRVGQIRRVDSPSWTDAESKMCVVLIVREDEGHAMVAIAWSGDSYPTTRDVLLPREATGARFDLHASVDHVVTVGLDQFNTTVIAGHASDAAVELLTNAPWLPNDFASEVEDAGLETGLVSVQWGDQLWAHRTREARNAGKLFWQP